MATGAATVTFTATDECGLSSSTTGTFTINDTMGPTITAPEAITLECGSQGNEAIINNWLTGYTAADGCSDVTVTNDFAAAPTMCEGGMNEVTVTWTAEDECGMMVTATSTITIVDNTKPVVMTPPTDLILECSDPASDNDAMILAWTTAFGNMTTIDNCDTPVLSFSAGTATDGCGNAFTTPYTFTSTDACGNSISEVAYLRVVDTTPPVHDASSSPTIIGCPATNPTAISSFLSGLTATDNCDDDVDISIALVSTSTQCLGTFSIESYLYAITATDDCGNQSNIERVVTFLDNTVPTITAPANLEVACGDDIATMITAWLDDYSVVEACQDFTVTNNYAGSVPSLCGGTETVTWTVIDGCGAMSTATSMIIIAEDTTPPTFANISDDLTVNVDIDNCESSVVFSTPIGADCNEPVSITQVANAAGDLIVSGSEFPLGTTTVVFEAEDACGNTARDSFDITVVDSQLPSLSCPSNDVVKCNDTGVCTWAADMSTDAIFADNCMGFDLSYAITGATTAMGDSLPRLDAVMFALGTSTVEYTLTDPAGNEVTCSFDVVVNDCEAPIITCPTPEILELECADAGNEMAIMNWLAEAMATDNCTDPLEVTNTVASKVNGCGLTSTTTYTFTATDEAGNTSTCSAQIVIIDTTDPAIDTEAMDMTVECDGQGNNADLISWLTSNGGAAASDDCGNVTWSNDFDLLSDDCGSTGTKEVVFTATDECGNTMITMATFTIRIYGCRWMWRCLCY